MPPGYLAAMYNNMVHHEYMMGANHTKTEEEALFKNNLMRALSAYLSLLAYNTEKEYNAILKNDRDEDEDSETGTTVPAP